MMWLVNTVALNVILIFVDSGHAATVTVEYKSSSTARSWCDAENECRIWGGHLAAPTSPTENDQLWNIIKTSYGSLLPHTIWLGMNDIAFEGQWTSQQTEEVMIYEHWRRRQPNGSRAENCVALDTRDGLWSDHPCHKHMEYVCQKVTTKVEKKWCDEGASRGRCGKNFLRPSGDMCECNPDDHPCCSSLGWCGVSVDHCNCQDCVDYRKFGNQSTSSWMQDTDINLKGTPVSDCIELNIEYSGPSIDVHVINSVPSWSDCLRLCQNESTCKFWTFKKALTDTVGMCELKPQITGSTEQSRAISGQRTCQGPLAVPTKSVCPIERGFCVQSNNADQDDGQMKLHDIKDFTEQSRYHCLKECQKLPGATGCEIIWNAWNSGCYVHTKAVAKGNGRENHMCWILSKCSGWINECCRENCTEIPGLVTNFTSSFLHEINRIRLTWNPPLQSSPWFVTKPLEFVIKQGRANYITNTTSIIIEDVPNNSTFTIYTRYFLDETYVNGKKVSLTPVNDDNATITTGNTNVNDNNHTDIAITIATIIVVVLVTIVGFKFRHKLKKACRPSKEEDFITTTSLPQPISPTLASSTVPPPHVLARVTSQGPVGTSTSLEDAGQCICNRHCNSFPLHDESYILPPVFISNITEAAGVQPNNGLSPTELKRFDGMLKNKGGEVAEKTLFDIFVTLTRNHRSSEHFLLLRGVVIDGGDEKKLKRKALFAELPTLDPTIDTSGEYDLFIFVKNLGIIIGEIKRTAIPDQIIKAEMQLNRGSHLANCLMKALTNNAVVNFPTTKLILLAEEGSSSPAAKSTYGTFILHQDLCKNIFAKWEEIIDELRQKKCTTSFADEDFERLANIFVGLWSAKSINKGKSLGFYDEEANVESLARKIDTMVKQGKITSRETSGRNAPTMPLANVSRCQISEIFRKAAGPTLLYLSPEQRDLFDNVPVAIVNGNAGSGKSLCLLFKVMDMYHRDNSVKILIIVPSPHDYRLQRVLSINNIDVQRINLFPPEPSSRNPVYIISLDAFFGVSRQDLLSYPLKDYNLFMDDAQNYQRKYENESSYSDIAEFIEQAASNASAAGLVLWFLIDAVQGGLHASDDYSVNLFKQTPITSIPIFTLTQVLRNTREIIEVADEVRSEEILAKSRLKLKGIIPEFVEGHGITSMNILYHKLQRRTRMNTTDFDYTKLFLLERIEEEIERIAGPNHTGSYSDIAILFGLYQLDDYKQPVENMLASQFNAKTQTVLELERDGDNGGIILDNVANTMSFECMCVIYVLTNASYAYNLVTRARVILTVIDLMTESPPTMNFKNIDLLKWGDDGNTFSMYQ